jgi:hypothetical protein
LVAASLFDSGDVEEADAQIRRHVQFAGQLDFVGQIDQVAAVAADLNVLALIAEMPFSAPSVSVNLTRARRASSLS